MSPVSLAISIDNLLLTCKQWRGTVCMSKRVFIWHKATQKCTCCSKSDCELWYAGKETAKLRSSVSRKQFHSHREADLLLSIWHRQTGIQTQSCIMRVGWENKSWMLLLNDQGQNKRQWVLPLKQGFSTWHCCHLELATLSLGLSRAL